MNMYENFMIISVISSLIYYEITETSPGGVITPGYFALFYNQPERIVLTIVIALCTTWILKLLKQKITLYGRRQFAFVLIIGIIIKVLISNLSGVFSVSFATSDPIGLIIPGLISNDMSKQSITSTLISLSIVSIFLISVLMLIGPRY